MVIYSEEQEEASLRTHPAPVQMTEDSSFPCLKNVLLLLIHLYTFEMAFTELEV